jgi:hypothetical protein
VRKALGEMKRQLLSISNAFYLNVVINKVQVTSLELGVDGDPLGGWVIV